MPNASPLKKGLIGVEEMTALETPAKFPPLGKAGSFLNTKSVISRIKVPDFKNQPETMVVCAPCRSGSTALYCAFAQVIPAGYQPIKAIVRGGLSEFVMPAVSKFFIKETFGTAFIEEVEFDPFQILLAAGLAPQKIHPTFLIRDPFACLDSWKRRMAGAKLELFRAAYRQVLELYEKSLAAGANPMIVEYEDLISNPRKELSRLANRLQFDVRDQMLQWSDGMLPFENDSRPEVAENGVVPSTHRRVIDETLSPGCITEISNSPSTLTLSDREWIKINVQPVYEALRLNRTSRCGSLLTAQSKPFDGMLEALREG